MRKMSEKRDPLEYVLNRMEAERDKKPPTVGYPPARKELLDGITALRAENDRLRNMIEIEREGQRAMARALSEIHRLSRLDVAVNGAVLPNDGASR